MTGVRAHPPKAWALVAIGGLALLGGCDADQPVETSAALDGVEVTVVQQRLDEGTRRIGIRVTTDADTTLHVRAVQLRSAGFELVPATAKDTTFAPGQVIDLTTTYGDVDCGEVPAEGLAATLTIEEPAGLHTVTVPVIGSGIELVQRLHESECAARALRRAADLSYGAFSRDRVRGEEVLVGALELRRPAVGGSGQAVVVESLSGTVLFAFQPRAELASTPVARLAPTADRLSVPVLIGSSGRCDQHTRSQSTQTFLFSVFVRVGSAGEHREILVPPRDLQRAALALLDEVC